MKCEYKLCVRVLFLSFLMLAYSQIKGLEVKHVLENAAIKDSTDSVTRLIELLNNLSQNSGNEFFKRHCASIINVVKYKEDISLNEKNFVNNLYSALTDTNCSWKPSELSSYLERKRPFIISWTSQNGGLASPAWLLPPKNWNPDKSYPLYVWLHGFYAEYGNRIEYMTTYLCKDSTINFPFDDGYLLLPWGYGNSWFEGKGETDVLESVAAAEAVLKVDKTKKYLCGFSMGGYGTWYIGSRLPDEWAALGIMSGNFSYITQSVNANTAQKMKDVPVYIVSGDKDFLLQDNLIVYNLLKAAGNQNLSYSTFKGGHESSYENQKKMGDWLARWKNENVNSVKTNDIRGQLELYQNYPNPFNPGTTIRYLIPNQLSKHISSLQHVTLRIYDVLGRVIATLVNEEKPPGEYVINFNCAGLSSGVYFYKLQVGRLVQTKKMIVVK